MTYDLVHVACSQLIILVAYVNSIAVRGKAIAKIFVFLLLLSWFLQQYAACILHTHTVTLSAFLPVVGAALFISEHSTFRASKKEYGVNSRHSSFVFRSSFCCVHFDLAIASSLSGVSQLWRSVAGKVIDNRFFFSILKDGRKEEEESYQCKEGGRGWVWNSRKHRFPW